MVSFYNKQFAFSLTLALLVWLIWFAFGGQIEAINTTIEQWKIALTMLFGSFIAGATSEGGGAIAFPVFTKILHISPHDAKIFSLAIQSIGMTAASLVIIFMRINIEWRVVLWASLGGVFGISVSTLWVAKLLAPEIIRITFTVIASSFAVALFIMGRNTRQYNDSLPRFFKKEKAILLLVGFVGGFVSGLVGNGIDILTFSVIVILFRVSEKVATPTSVLLMAINAMIGFAIHFFILDDFSSTIQTYWIAAVPVVVFGAPLGAIYCSLLNRKVIAALLMVLIAVELVSSLYILPLTLPVIFYSVIVFSCFLFIYFKMLNTLTYAPNNKIIRI